MFLPATLVAFALAQPSAQKPFEFKDGDRIVWIGNTSVEREQRYGYWETALLAANKDKKIPMADYKQLRPATDDDTRIEVT